MTCAASALVFATPAPAEDLGSQYANELQAVSALSASDAWAVGYTNFGQTAVILHWNGHAWSQMSAPTPGKLFGVKAITASNVWAVGSYSSSHVVRTLILHWNGTTWSKLTSPNPSTLFNQLDDVNAISATNAWAVGYYVDPQNHAKHYGIALHWNGSSWVRMPNAGQELDGVAATSTTNVWAVGGSVNVWRWNGSAWSAQYSLAGAGLFHVAALSSTNAWAVGDVSVSGGKRTLIVHWNGTRWSRVASPNVSSGFNTLSGVAATSATNAWAVGCYGTTGACVSSNTLLLRWNGSTWSRVATSHPGAHGNRLAAVSAVSSSIAWAVGATKNASDVTAALRLRWNGTTWAIG